MSTMGICLDGGNGAPGRKASSFAAFTARAVRGYKRPPSGGHGGGPNESAGLDEAPLWPMA